jgi:hypothetical protein
VRHVHDAHEAEDEREPARHDEVEAGERQAVQKDDDEGARLPGERVLGDHEHPEEDERRDGEEDPPHGERAGLPLEEAKTPSDGWSFGPLAHPVTPLVARGERS